MSNTAIARTMQSTVQKVATAALTDLNPEKAKAAATRIALQFADSVASARRPEAWKDLSPASIASAVGASMATDLYPGGPMPTVYLIPKAGQLQWRITHRGLCELCRREGYHVRTVAVGREDELEQSLGLVTHHRPADDTIPRRLEDLRGIVVAVRGPDGAELAYYVPRALIEERRAKSDMPNKGPWRDWPIEMAQKTAILYCAARGYLPISSSMQAAMTADPIEVEAVADERPRRGREIPRYDQAPEVVEPELEPELDPETGEPLPEGP